MSPSEKPTIAAQPNGPAAAAIATAAAYTPAAAEHGRVLGTR